MTRIGDRKVGRSKRNSRCKSPPGTKRYYEEAFDDLMGYVERYAGEFKGGSSEDLRDWLSSQDRKGFLSTSFLDHLEDTDKWTDLTEKEKGEPKTAERKRSAAITALSKAPPRVQERVKKMVKAGYHSFLRDGEFFIVEKGGRTRNARTGRFAKRRTDKTYSKEFPAG